MNVMEGRYEFDPAAANAQLNQYPQQRVYVADPNAYGQLPYDDGTYQAAPPAQQWSTHGPVHLPNGEWSAPVADPYNQSDSVMRAEGEQGHYLPVQGGAPVNPSPNQYVPERDEKEGEYSDVEYVTSSDDEEEEKEQPRVQLRATAARPAQQVPAPVVAEPTPPVATATSSAETNTPRARRGYNRATEAIKGTAEYVEIRRLNNEASARCRDKKRKEQEKKEEQLRATLDGLSAVVESLKTDVAVLKEEKKQLSELRAEVDSLREDVAELKEEKKQLSELRAEVDSLRADVAGVKGEVTNVRQQCNTKFVRLHALLNAERAELL